MAPFSCYHPKSICSYLWLMTTGPSWCVPSSSSFVSIRSWNEHHIQEGITYNYSFPRPRLILSYHGSKVVALALLAELASNSCTLYWSCLLPSIEDLHPLFAAKHMDKDEVFITFQPPLRLWIWSRSHPLLLNPQRQWWRLNVEPAQST